jgi:hypothetical protein
MRFEHPVHEATFERLRELLREMFDDPFHEEENDHFYVRYGSTVLELSVEAYGAEEAMVTIMAYCVQGVEVEEQLLLGLLEVNHSLDCGSFSLVGTDIFCSHSLFGRSLEPGDLLRAVTAIATLSDEYDDRIVARYGGQTALDRIRDTGGRRRRQGLGDD